MKIIQVNLGKTNWHNLFLVNALELVRFKFNF